jgi:MFS family permease
MTSITFDGPGQDAQPLLDGRRAWSFVAAASLASAVALGTVTSHGVLVAALAPLTIAGVGAGAVLVAISAVCQFGLGPVVGRMADRFGVARVVLVGALTYGAGAATAAVSRDLATSVVVYAVGTGIAGSCTLAPLLAAAAGWHRRRRSAAVAIVSAGNGIGALLLAPLLASSVQELGLRPTWALLGAGGTALLLLSLTVLRTPPRADGAGRAPSLRSLFRDLPFRRLYLAGVLGSAAVIGTLAYLVPYAAEVGFSARFAAGLLGLTGAIGVVGRLLVSTVPPRHVLRAYLGTQAVLAASAVFWLAASGGSVHLVVFAVTFGSAAGMWSALAPLVVADAYPQRLASVLGAIYTSPAIGGLLGPLLIGAWSVGRPMQQIGWFLAGCFVLAVLVLRPLTAASPGRNVDA